MSGAWIAATQDRTRFSKMNGYGSNELDASMTLITIHRTRTPVKEKINAQLPANFAMVSAARCPNVYLSYPLSGLTEIWLSASRFSTSSSVISWRISLRTSFNNFLFSFMVVHPLLLCFVKRKKIISFFRLLLLYPLPLFVSSMQTHTCFINFEIEETPLSREPCRGFLTKT